VNIRLQQINPTIGDLSGNKALIIDAIQKAETDDVDLLILPELCVCGYPPMDLLEREDFITLALQTNREIVSSTRSATVIFGAVTPNESGTGRKLFNSAIIARHGSEQQTIHKALLPTYDVFDDLRYFEPNMIFEPVTIDGINFGITICEDIWYNENEFQYHHYDVNPAKELTEKGAQAIINISASPFTKTKPLSRLNMLKTHAGQLGIPVLYANQVGANTELIFDGASVAVDHKGQLVADTDLFTPQHVDINFDGQKITTAKELKNQFRWPKEQLIFNALKTGLTDYLAKTAFTDSVVLGLSGGIDSALVCTVAAEALGAEKVTAVTMPSHFSSKGSITDSETLVQNLGVRLEQISIKQIYDSFLTQLKPLFEGHPFGVAEENLQSRIRGNLLMALSNKFGYMLLNTSNKSELAVGYGTLYGDMSGGLGLISDLYKTEVYALSEWLNKVYFKKIVIPESIIHKAPSAELRPDQKDADSLPEYHILDQILMYYLEEQKSIEFISSKGYDKSIVKTVVSMVQNSEHKRYQSPPGLKISAKAFGVGRRCPIAQKWYSQAENVKESILSK